MRRRTTLLTSRLSALGLAAALTAATAGTGAADEPGLGYEMREAPAARSGGAAERLVSATATFGPANRATGMPTSTAPQHQLVMPGGSLSVTVEYGYDWETGALTYNYSLDTDLAEPSGDTVVRLGFGAVQGSTCMLEEVTAARSYTYITDVLLYDNKETDDLASAAAWDCAVLIVGSGDFAATPFDAYVSPLAVTTATPELTLEAPKKDRLVTGVWTRIPVRVTNASPEEIAARDVVVSGKGKGVKVRTAKLGEIEGQDDSEADVWVKLTRPNATVRLTVKDMGETLGKASVKVKRRPAPPAPRAGSWSGGDASFTVRGSKVRGFRIITRTTCGGYPDVPTTSQVTYSFQTTAIPRNNEVVGTERGNQGGDAAYSAYLELEFVSPTKARGTFSYYGPARCTAFGSFTAKRKR